MIFRYNMKTFTTKGATDLLYTDDFRSNGCPDVLCLQDESGEVELEALTEEVEKALEELKMEIESDVIPDEVMTSLIEHLNSARALDVPV